MPKLLSFISANLGYAQKSLLARNLQRIFKAHQYSLYFIKVHYICEGLSGQVRKHTVRLARRVLSFFSSRRNWIWNYPRDHFKSLNWPIELFSKNFAWIIGKNLYSHEHPAFKKGPNWALLKSSPHPVEIEKKNCFCKRTEMSATVRSFSLLFIWIITKIISFIIFNSARTSITISPSSSPAN